MPFTRALAIASIGGMFPAAALAQVTLVDEGAFLVTRAGRPVGREEFSIRSTPGSAGPMHVAQGTAVYGERRLTPVLNVDQNGQPSRYAVEVRVGAAVEHSLNAHATRGRFVSRARGADGESEREYVVGENAVLVDEELFHQYYFLARRSRNGEVAVVVPRRSALQRWRVATQGDESITVGGSRRAAIRLLVSPEGAPDRVVWIDADTGRVLQVAIPSQQIVATREEVPR